MAFNSTNRIRSVVVGEFEDKISSETAKAGSNVNSTLKQMERQTKEATSGFKALEKTMKAVGAALIFQQGMQAATAMVAYAREHNTQATSLVQKLDTTVTRTLAIVTNSEAFKLALSSTVAIIEKINELLGNVTDNVLKQAKFSVEINKASKDYVAKQLESKELTGEQRDLLYEQQKLWGNTLKFAEDNLAVLEQQKKEQDAATTGLENSKAASVDLYEIAKARIEMEIDNAGKHLFYEAEMIKLAQKRKQIEDSMPKVPTGLPAAAPQDIPGGLPDSPGSPGFMPKTEEIFGNSFTQNLIDVREQFQKMYSEDMPTFAQVASQTANIISGGLGNAFDSMGAAIARGQSAMCAFAKGMIAVAGQVAGSFGDMFIKLGLAALFINPAQGIGLIAAGAALKVLAGFLGAKASGGVSSSSGPSSPPRDYGSDRLSSGKAAGNIYVTVNVKNDMLDPSGYNEKRFNEVSYNIGKNFAEQIQRGRGNV